jgi:hypothetical protein
VVAVTADVALVKQRATGAGVKFLSLVCLPTSICILLHLNFLLANLHEVWKVYLQLKLGKKVKKCEGYKSMVRSMTPATSSSLLDRLLTDPTWLCMPVGKFTWLPSVLAVSFGHNNSDTWAYCADMRGCQSAGDADRDWDWTHQSV